MIKIAITPRHMSNKDGSFFCIEKKYVDFWKRYGYELIMIPFHEDIDFNNFFKSLGIKALLISGGYQYYTKEIRKFELKAIDFAIKNNLPLFGVCCGMWSINGFFGGTLKWNENHSKRNIKFLTSALAKRFVFRKHINIHNVTITGLLGINKASVNSYHRKVIDVLGSGLTPFIFSDDGEIEGIFNLNKKILAVQFHLEQGNCTIGFEKKYMGLVKNLVMRG